jgi:hypothetical protein
MPPHCDALDGPVVHAARDALTANDVDVVLPFVSPEGEPEVRGAFDLARKARAMGGEAADVADRWFFETTVRIHRAGEGAPFAGLKPAGLDVGPVIPTAERALASGSPDELAALLCDTVRSQVELRLAEVIARTPAADATVAERRRYVEAALGLQVWSHGVHRQLLSNPHRHAAATGHD